ncbi:MAG TPA: DUF3854 domain-containing protein [Herpetosiphonaceae bacterium]|nr:DUF3854 domain-containing protein [Herpetosiphonaceae bacterium]
MTTITAPALHDRHRRELEASGISPEVWEQRGARSVTDVSELAGLGFADYQCRVPALLLPSYGPDGRNGAYQLKPDRPRIDRTNGKPIKYENAAGSSSRIDVPRGMQKQVADRTVTLYITEGYKKADSAASKGIACVTLQGVWNFRGAALADWALIPLKDRDTRIIFDSDAAKNDNVRLAEKELARFLVSQGAHVRIKRIPPAADGTKQGLDDFLAAGGDIEALPDAPADEGEETTDNRAELRQAFHDAKEQRRRAKYVELLRRDRYVRRLVRDGGVSDALKIATLQMAPVTEEWEQKPAPGGRHRMYMQKMAKQFGVARATWTSRVDDLAAQTGVLEVEREDRTQPLIDPRTGRPVINQRTGRIAKDYDTAVMIRPKVYGTDLIAAVVERRFTPNAPRERQKKKARGRFCRKHPTAVLLVETTTTWRCPDCPADDNLIDERVHVREPERIAPLPNFGTPPPAREPGPATLPDFDPYVSSTRDQNPAPPPIGRDAEWHPGMPTFRLVERRAPLPNFGTPRPESPEPIAEIPQSDREPAAACIDCGRHPPVPYYRRCQSCIVGRLPVRSGQTAAPDPDQLVLAAAGGGV